jgi:hypothetical protein
MTVNRGKVPTVVEDRARRAEREYREAIAVLDRRLKARKAAMVRCVRSGMSLVDTGKIFAVSAQQIRNVVVEELRQSGAAVGEGSA